MAGLPLLPLESGGLGTMSTARGIDGAVEALFLATDTDRQLLAALPQLVVNTAILGAELSMRSVGPNL